MSGVPSPVAQCVNCGRSFEALEAFTDHLPGCARRIVMLREPRFREVPDGRVPRMRKGTFGEEARTREPDRATWAGMTQAERIDAGLRTGRIKTVTVPLEPVNDNVWRRLWRWITSK